MLRARARERATRAGNGTLQAANGLAAAVAGTHDDDMLTLSRPLLRATAAAWAAAAVTAAFAETPGTAPSGPAFTGDRLQFPADYREWIWLSTGFDMSYNPAFLNMGHHMFDNVFVDRPSWVAFRRTGTWPDKTSLLIEGRGAVEKASINRAGQHQGDVMVWELHVKDQARFPDEWGFFATSDPATPMQRLPSTAECYSCHRDHGAVDTTFVQFYPTLLPIATAKGTLSAAYVAEEKKR
jgi:hypothetical protein